MRLLPLLISLNKSCVYYLRKLSQTDEKLADKSAAADKSKLETAGNENVEWLDASQEGSEEIFFFARSCKKLHGVAGGAPGSAGSTGVFPDAGGFPGSAQAVSPEESPCAEVD